jgi:c-di-GMP-binding flagellar brake protein YcgR
MIGRFCQKTPNTPKSARIAHPGSRRTKRSNGNAMTAQFLMSEPGILLVDDGELDEVARVLESEGLAFTRLRGGTIPEQVAPPHELLIVTPRRLDRVRRGSPADAAPGRPTRIVAVQEDSPAMRRRLRRAGLNLLVRLVADPEIWRLVIIRALYDGSERREDLRVAVGSHVEIDSEVQTPAEAPSTTLLMDLSNRGCRLQTEHEFLEGDPIEFTIPGIHAAAAGEEEALTLAGKVRRIAQAHGSDLRTLAVVFEANMPEESRTRLTALINRWASGPVPRDAASRTLAPTIPPCQLPSLPDLTLDDETDPPVSAEAEIRVELGNSIETGAAAQDAERRNQQRGRFESPIRAQSHGGSIILIGRDLSAGGMRIESNSGLHLGDRFQLALHGPGGVEPFIVDAEIVRDDGDGGFALVFDGIDREAASELEKLVACLPDVESLDAGEIGGMGAVLSEILVDYN